MPIYSLIAKYKYYDGQILIIRISIVSAFMKYEITCPYCGNNQTYKPRKEVPKDPHTKCSKCKREFKFKVGNPDQTIVEKESRKVDKKSTPAKGSISPTTAEIAATIEAIENPVAYASAHIFKKMVETGDVRWAQLYVSLLDKTKKLDYETIREQEWLKQAANMSMEDLVSKVAVKGFTSKNILRRLEEAEDTSIYDNF